MKAARALIEQAYASPERRGTPEVHAAIEACIGALDRGEVRIATPPEEPDGDWEVHAWAKQAVLRYFGVAEMETIEVGPFEYHDKIPLKRGYASAGVRTVPPATVRRGAFIERGAILMPSYVNIGAWVGAGTALQARAGFCGRGHQVRFEIAGDGRAGGCDL